MPKSILPRANVGRICQNSTVGGRGGLPYLLELSRFTRRRNRKKKQRKSMRVSRCTERLQEKALQRVRCSKFRIAFTCRLSYQQSYLLRIILLTVSGLLRFKVHMVWWTLRFFFFFYERKGKESTIRSLSGSMLCDMFYRKFRGWGREWRIKITNCVLTAFAGIMRLSAFAHCIESNVICSRWVYTYTGIRERVYECMRFKRDLTNIDFLSPPGMLSDGATWSDERIFSVSVRENAVQNEKGWKWRE